MIVTKVLGMNFHSINEHDLINIVSRQLSLEKKNNYISITNTEALYFGSKNLKHFNYINNAFLSLCDGVGVKIGALTKRKKIIRYNGPKLFNDLIYHGQKNNWKHYFLGGTEKVVNNLKDVVMENYPEANIVGLYSPPFRDLNHDEEKKMISEINMLKPDFIWIGLGLPKQEKWIMKYINKIDVGFAIGVGAVFDTQTGNIRRAPRIFQRFGLEWFYRVIFEPRMIPRLARSFQIMFNVIFKRENKK